MNVRTTGTSVVGRDPEVAVLTRVLADNGPRICFVWGLAGIGKSSLLGRFRDECDDAGVNTYSVDCRSIEPTERSFLDGLGREIDPSLVVTSPDDLLGLGVTNRAVVIIDTYELFRIADPWLRHELLPALGPNVRVVVAGREPPMLEWAVERGQLGGLDVLPLGPLDEQAVATMLCTAGVDDPPTVAAISRVARGHPLALRLAIEARLAGGELPQADTMPKVVQALAGTFRAGLDAPARRALDAAAVPRRITHGVLAAMLGDDADDALEMLGTLSFVEATADGLRLHDAVQLAIVERLRSVDPERFRRYRTAAWHHLRGAAGAVGRHEQARSTADLLFLIDNPVVREAMFPTSAHMYSVEQFRPEDADDVRSLWHQHDPGQGAETLDHWLRRLPAAIRVIRDRARTVAGCVVAAEWRDIPHSIERDDPVMAAFARHAALHRLPNGQRSLVLRRVLSREAGERPCGAQAVAWLDVKRDYFQMRPQLGRLYTTLVDPAPYLDVMTVLGFELLAEQAQVGDTTCLLASLTFGPESVDGWLSNLAAAELGIDAQPFLDAGGRTVDIGQCRVPLSPLEFGVMELLASRPGLAVTRVELLEHVWGTSYTGGSNVVDVVVRSLRRKLGPLAPRLETARGIGYRLK